MTDVTQILSQLAMRQCYTHDYEAAQASSYEQAVAKLEQLPEVREPLRRYRGMVEQKLKSDNRDPPDSGGKSGS